MKRLCTAPLAAGKMVLHGEAHHYLARVLRARAGETIALFDGAGVEADAVIVSVGGDVLELAVGVPRAATRGAEIILVVGMLKGDKMDWVVQKATELGVARVVPVAAHNAVARAEGDRAAAKTARWQKIAQEAARQSGRADVPEVAEVSSFADALSLAPPHAWRVLFHEGERGQAFTPPAGTTSVCAAVGPEGGFTPDEVAAARAAGFTIAGLSRHVLRAETAAIAAVAILAHLL